MQDYTLDASQIDLANRTKESIKSSIPGRKGTELMFAQEHLRRIESSVESIQDVNSCRARRQVAYETLLGSLAAWSENLNS